MLKIMLKPKFFTGGESWENRMEGVIFVSNEEDKEHIFRLLVEQDNYWEYYKNLIKIAPEEIDDITDIENLCEYCGKTDIYNYKELKSKVDFISYQFRENY